MNVNLAGLLKNAAHSIDPDKDTGAYAYMLGEVASHIHDVQTGKHTIAEFCEHYCIMPKDPK